MTSTATTLRRLPTIAFAVLMVLAIAWAYLPTIHGLISLWDTDPNYSQGFLVPILAAGLCWYLYHSSSPIARQPDMLGGLILLAVATGLRAASAYYYISPLDHLSMLVMLAGVCLVLAGRQWLARLWPSIALLVFMFPIPNTFGGGAVTGTLQTLSTRASTVALQTLGLTAYREGNVIILKGAELGIVEACSGLRMLMVFCTLSVVTAVLVPTGLIRKGIIILSAVPLAIFCNVLRITVAGIASDYLGSKAGHFIFHDLAGWLMVPLAFALLAVELTILGYLFQAVRTDLADQVENPGEKAPSVETASPDPHDVLASVGAD